VTEADLYQRVLDHVAWATANGPVQPERRLLKPWPGLRDVWFVDDETFVGEAFRLLLGREADPDGLAHYTAQLRLGLARLELVRHLADSAEGSYWELDRTWWPKVVAFAIPTGLREAWPLPDGEFLARAYQLVLGRGIDPNGFLHHSTMLKRGQPREAFIEHLADSKEARGRRIGTAWLSALKWIPLEAAVRSVWGLPDDAFLEALYRLVLGRGTDPNGREHHGRLLRAGVPRVEVLRQLVLGPEAAGKYGDPAWLEDWEAEAMAEVLAAPDAQTFLHGAYWLVRRRRPRRRELAVQVPLLRWLPFYRRRHVLRRLLAGAPRPEVKEAA
jgi:hypothetical protein